MATDIVRALRELAATARDGYTGIAAYECRGIETEIAEMVARIAEETAGRLELLEGDSD